MKRRKYKYFAADFETTVYSGQAHTEVWAAACGELYTEEVHVFHSIEEQWEYFLSLKTDVCAFYHNLKFDGEFWLSYFMSVLELRQAFDSKSKVVQPKDMPNNSFNYMISSTGQWYRITAKVHGKVIELRDSLKLLPFTLKRIGESFGTKHKKLDMEYKGFRYAGCEITAEEEEYIKNDVFVLKEALEFMFNEQHNKLTIGSCCLAEYKSLIGHKHYQNLFPRLEQQQIVKEIYGSKTVDEYIRKSYRGGWCYVTKGKENKLLSNGTTADVNSLYPSMMSSESGNFYPIGEPTFWSGDYIPNEAQGNGRYYFVRFRTRFYLKPNKLPFIQVKNSFRYIETEMLETSDRYNSETGEYSRYFVDLDGNIQDSYLILTMTQTDFALFREHYRLEDFEILDGCYFQAAIGIFDVYIEKYKKIKLDSKGAMRELAKLFLNNLYGKTAASTDSAFKIAFLKDDRTIGFRTVSEKDKEAGYIAVGSAITSYARCFTIRAAQANYHGVNSRGFVYADTDSIHCDLEPSEIKGIKVHDKNFCCWKLESTWDIGYFVRQKTYIEHIVGEDGESVDPYYNVKCAGMPDRCKQLFLKSMGENITMTNLTDDELDFLSTTRTLQDFQVGLAIPGKLLPKHIRGGIVLADTVYSMR